MVCQVVFDNLPKLIYNTLLKLSHFSNLYKPTYEDLLESTGREVSLPLKNFKHQLTGLLFSQALDSIKTASLILPILQI